ncbi:SPOR domain-containing protein [Persicitalea jodogahamensis]|uniref:SPOR domain-containing protein n=1 Tax=Persicitalea jodogahamensis TaxID=402147 RepID=A0A8J3D4J9_9BACT|nr:SPOR domain-containing protein [Persicitalea jodogahamensis]GHB58808.1 hypothetical protein GCM10007390_10470 [Persicitalea jodogahamensis]
MEQPTRNKENSKPVRQRNQSKSKKGYASNKPWWLVAVIVVVLAGFLFYIKWLNSPAANEYQSFWAYLVGPKLTEVRSDPSVATADEIDALFGADSIGAGLGDEWAETSPTTTASTLDDEFTAGNTPAPESIATPVAPPPARPVTAPTTPAVSEGTVYVINAGEFKTKGSAQFRIGELRQGNYAARLIEPSSPDGMYKVVVGEYKNESTAKSVAQSMSFILEIRASVEEKR